MKTCVNAYRSLLAYNFVSNEEARYYLNGVALQPHPKGDGIFIVATDGHRLGVFHDPNGRVPGNCILQLPKDFRSAILKECRKRDVNEDILPLTFDMAPNQTGPVKVTVGDVTMTATLIDGTFPDWARVVPKQRPEEHIPQRWDDQRKEYTAGKKANPEAAGQLAFNAQYVADFGKIKELGHKMPAAVRMTAGKDPGDPMFVDTGYPGFFGVLMPFRPPALPSLAWFDDRLPKAEEPGNVVKLPKAAA